MADITRNITLQQGAPVSILFIAKLTVEGSPIDLTDKAITATMRRASAAYTDYNFTVNVTDAINGEFYIEMTEEYLGNIPASRCIYEIHMDDAGTDTRLYTGLSIVLAEGVTNTSPDNYASNQQNTFKDVSDGYFVKWEDNLIIDASVGEFELILPDNPTKGFLFDFIDKGNTFSSLTPVTLRNSTDVIDSVEISGYYTFVWSGNIWASYRGQDSSSVAGVTSVAGRGGDVVLTSTDVGLENVDNTSDTNKPLSDATIDALADKLDIGTTTADIPDSVDKRYVTDVVSAILDNLGTAATHDATDFEPSGTTSAHAALTIAHGISAFGATLVDDTDSNAARNTLGLGNVNNTSDTNKPVSIAQAAADGVVLASANTYTDDKITANIVDGDTTHSPSSDAVFDALAAKESTITATTSADYYRGDKTFQTLNKAAVGLSNVDNTSDANKPVSTAQATADGVVLTAAQTYASNPSNITQDSTHRFATDAEKTTWNAKQNALGYTPENVTNKQTDLTASATKYPTVNAVNTGLSTNLSAAQSYADGKVIDSIADSDTTHAPSRNAVFDALATKESIITATTSADYYRGDKTFQPLNKAAVGLSNVDNTSDANKPVSTAQATADGVVLSSAQSYADGKLTATITNGDTTHAPTGDAVFDALALKESVITATTSADYYRGDKTFQPLNKAAVGLSNVDNTSDVNKPVSTAQATADGVVLSSAQSYADGKVIDSIADSDTTHAPSRNAVFDALALKLDTSATTANVPDSLNKRYVTDAQLTTLGNTTNINSGDQNLFSTIAVAGQSNVVADNASDTLTLVEGSNITITTNAATDEITISSTGGGGGSLTTFKDDIDFGNNKYSAEVSVADATATIDDSLLLTLVNGSTMSAEEAVIQEITLACTTVVGVGYTITAYAPLGADGIISFVGLKVGT